MIPHRVLVVEDEKPLLHLLRYNLEKQGYRVFTAPDGEEALSLARRHRPDLILLDIMLPKLDGLAVCHELRKDSQVPIVFLTAKKSEIDRISGLKLGADDYVTKPFSVGELLARVEAILRRTKPAEAAADVTATGPLRFGELEVDFERHESRVKKKPITLTPKEFDFLRLLIEADGRVLSRATLLERIWGYDRAMDIDTRTVDQHIARLRRKLKSEGRRVATVTNSGYRFRKG